MSAAAALALFVAGVALVAGALEYSHRREGLAAGLVALAAPVGFLAAVAGLVAFFVPGFFG
ncbi:hypothetical protein K8I61_05790 [bacterium]|nr:hypothetical protein [bacterium]